MPVENSVRNAGSERHLKARNVIIAARAAGITDTQLAEVTGLKTEFMRMHASDRRATCGNAALTCLMNGVERLFNERMGAMRNLKDVIIEARIG